MHQPYVTYLLTNPQHDAFYAGTTRDLEFAVATHRQGIADVLPEPTTSINWFGSVKTMT